MTSSRTGRLEPSLWVFGHAASAAAQGGEYSRQGAGYARTAFRTSSLNGSSVTLILMQSKGRQNSESDIHLYLSSNGTSSITYTQRLPVILPFLFLVYLKRV